MRVAGAGPLTGSRALTIGGPPSEGPVGSCSSRPMRCSPSTSTLGSRRSSHRGSHHAVRSNSAIAAGTTSIRTTVASRKIAEENPMASSFSLGSLARAKLANTPIMISAAAVITRAELVRPDTTLARASPVRT